MAANSTPESGGAVAGDLTQAQMDARWLVSMAAAVGSDSTLRMDAAQQATLRNIADRLRTPPTPEPARDGGGAVGGETVMAALHFGEPPAYDAPLADILGYLTRVYDARTPGQWGLARLGPEPLADPGRWFAECLSHGDGDVWAVTTPDGESNDGVIVGVTGNGPCSARNAWLLVCAAAYMPRLLAASQPAPAGEPSVAVLRRADSLAFVHGAVLGMADADPHGEVALLPLHEYRALVALCDQPAPAPAGGDVAAAVGRCGGDIGRLLGLFREAIESDTFHGEEAARLAVLAAHEAAVRAVDICRTCDGEMIVECQHGVPGLEASTTCPTCDGTGKRVPDTEIQRLRVAAGDWEAERARAEALGADAERFRWLAQQSWWAPGRWAPPAGPEPSTDLRAAIDEARAAETAGGGQ